MLKAILHVLSDGKPHSYGSIERKADTNWKTVRDHTELLMLIDAVVISDEDRVRITDKGKVLLRRL